MPIHDHQPAFRGRAFFWGGIILGVLLVAVLLTHGFGLMRPAARPDDAPAWSVELAKAGPNPQVALESSYGWY